MNMIKYLGMIIVMVIVIYTNPEAFLEKVDTCENSLEKSFTIDVNKPRVCRCSKKLCL